MTNKQKANEVTGMAEDRGLREGAFVQMPLTREEVGWIAERRSWEDQMKEESE